MGMPDGEIPVMRFSSWRLLRSPVLIAGVALALHIVLLYQDVRPPSDSETGRASYGFELGNVASSIAAGDGFSSRLSTVARSARSLMKASTCSRLASRRVGVPQ